MTLDVYRQTYWVKETSVENLPVPEPEKDRPALEERIPGLADAQTWHEKADALLRVIGDPSVIDDEDDCDLIVDHAFVALSNIPDLPDKTVDVMQEILTYEDHVDLSRSNQMYSCDVLAHLGERAERCLPTLRKNLLLAESNSNSDKALALRSARAIWKISGDPQPVERIASMLLRDEEDWIASHAQSLLDEVEDNGR